jgi:putative PLP-dependent aminotransferase (TIGR04422 family)
MWPQYKLKESLQNLIIFHLKKIISIDKKIKSNCIFVPSARYAIANILKCYNFDKMSKIAVAPFSNECIYNSAGYVSTPIPSNINTKFDAQLIYHMFGYNYKSELKTFTIEDSVDTFIFNEKKLFLNNGNFEIISIPKVTNFCFGSIIYCKTTGYRKKLNNFLKKKGRKFFNLQFYLMMIGNESFDFRRKQSHYEKQMPLIVSEFLNYLYFKSLNFEDNIKRKIDVIYNNIDDKPKLLDGRYPSSLSIKVSKKMKNKLLLKFPFLYERTINQTMNFTNWDLKKKIFLPINQDISVSEIVELKNYLKKS